MEEEGGRKLGGREQFLDEAGWEGEERRGGKGGLREGGEEGRGGSGRRGYRKVEEVGEITQYTYSFVPVQTKKKGCSPTLFYVDKYIYIHPEKKGRNKKYSDPACIILWQISFNCDGQTRQ